MLLGEISKTLEADFIGDIKSYNKEISMSCGSDLMSDVLAFIKPDSLLLTGLVNPQVIRTAEMAEVAAICFVRGKLPQKETVKLANEKKLPLLTTKLSMYESCGRLYREGLPSCDEFR
jgi:predicted transcriptional regulator